MRLDSWYAAKRLLHCCRRPGWHGVCAITSQRTLDDQKRSPWPQTLQHQRYQRVPLTATDQQSRPSLVRTLPGKLTQLSLEVCGLISKRHHRDKRPQYVLCTDLSLSAQHILPISHKRWPIEVEHVYVKQPLGWADLRVQSYEATAQWLAVVLLALAFFHWRLNHAPSKARWRSLADVVRQHRYAHARTLLETACQEAVKLTDDLPVLQRFLCQPT